MEGGVLPNMACTPCSWLADIIYLPTYQGYGPDDYQNYSSYSGYEQSQGGYDQDYYMQPASSE